MKFKRILFTATLVYLGLISVLYIVQRKMIFFPDQSRPTAVAYSSWGNGVYDISVTTEDGLNITGWSHKADDNKPTIIFFHGNAGHYGHRIHKVENYIKSGYGIVIVGYRGYGGNNGEPSEQGFYKDARAYINSVINSGVSEENIILYGQSIGSGVAVQMATEFLHAKALILAAPYTSLPDVAKQRYFFIPVNLLMKDKFNSLSKIGGVKVPLLVMLGLRDRVIPPTLGLRLFKAANEPKEILQLEGFGHNDLPESLLSEKVMDFVGD